jgi:hypothetical protein
MWTMFGQKIMGKRAFFCIFMIGIMLKMSVGNEPQNHDNDKQTNTEIQ